MMTSHSSPSKLDRYDVILEDAIAACNGDVHGALRALMLVNERLETRIGGAADRDGNRYKRG